MATSEHVTRVLLDATGPLAGLEAGCEVDPEWKLILHRRRGGTVSKLRGIHFIQFGARLRQFEEGFTSGIVLGNKITLTCSVLGNLLGFFTFNPCFCCGPSSSNFDFGCAAVAEESGESALGSDH